MIVPSYTVELPPAITCLEEMTTAVIFRFPQGRHRCSAATIVEPADKKNESDQAGFFNQSPSNRDVRESKLSRTNDGNKRWAIAPPPPTSATDRAHSPHGAAHPSQGSQRVPAGECALSLDEDLLDPQSEIFSRRLHSSLVPSLSNAMPSAVGHSVSFSAAHPTLAPEEIEPFDSERVTEVPSAAVTLAPSEREVPTIPAAPLDELDAVALAIPPVPTGRGFFLESVQLDQDLPASAPSVADLSIEFDVDEGL